MRSLPLIFIASGLVFMQSLSVSAFTVTNNPAYSPEQCTEFRDGNRVFQNKYIYVHEDGKYSNETITATGIYLMDGFYNYGNEFVIRGSTSSINIINNLSSKVTVPSTYAEWRMPTNYVPARESIYVVMGAMNPIVINRALLVPSDSQNPMFQVAYSLTRARTESTSSRSLGPVIWQYLEN
jgi:hypothetical protein